MDKKKQDTFESPDISKLQAVIIDARTTIFISIGEDPEEAKKRYLSRYEERKNFKGKKNSS